MSLKAPIGLFGSRSSGTPPLPASSYVIIANTGNPDDNTGYGGVSYRYGIGRYAVRESDIADYNADPANSANIITLDTRGDDKPATEVSWNEAARYVNWLNTRDNYQPAYKFDSDGANNNITLWSSGEAWQDDGENLYRHKDAEYFLPSEDEWYKAAYYNGIGYYDYATGSDTAPTPTAGSEITGEAVYDGQSGPADVTNAGGLSPYGTMGQGGNTYEWIESANDGTNDSAVDPRSVRGGSWGSSSSILQSSFRDGGNPSFENLSIGFRVAKRLPQLEFVLVENAGNPDDDTGYGGVPYNYRINKYAVRETDIDAYNADSLNDIKQISIDTRGDDKPATSVSWNEAARYVNWLNIKDGAQPAYKFLTTGSNDYISLWDSADAWQDGGENLYRHKNAKYFIPNENEWYKAAYYKSGGTNAGYWLYPTGSDTAPTGVASGTDPGTAVYSGQSGPADVTQAGGLSPYGTMGQGGNGYEWIESAFTAPNDSTTESRVIRGGVWGSSPYYLQSSTRDSLDPDFDRSNFGFGFRVAAVPD